MELKKIKKSIDAEGRTKCLMFLQRLIHFILLMECSSRGPSLDLLISLAVYFDVSTDYLLMGRDYVNLHSRKRLEGVLQELSGIIADLQDV